jgi:prolipoprotein diacylglyceryl transferase
MIESPHFIWDVGPELFRLGPLVVRWYGVLFATGFVIGFYIMRWMYVRERKPVADLDRLLIFLLVGTIVGARLGHCFFYEPAYYFRNPLAIPMVWKGGLASHGGTLGILIALVFYSRSRPGQPYLWLLDRVAVPTALTASLIRLGNLFNSEILGLPTEKPWAIVFARVDDVPRHPAQLYESVSYLIIFGVLMVLYKRMGKDTPHGFLVGLFLTLVFGMRILIEFVKERQAPFAETLPLSMGQMLSIPMVVVGVALMVWSLRNGKKED